ncbi:hypothetical protein SAMN04488550_2223 [Gordonia malaquae]|uniref:hypothetical protein n=1 Tax=Gordonia malaquae TaxID=410332 RepID=UPI0003496D05|nr:hypothetical protein [Gordonia malaquae]SED26566.1 hypothetical protein SAMN04488550_2223 [Gordonia malaquae]
MITIRRRAFGSACALAAIVGLVAVAAPGPSAADESSTATKTTSSSPPTSSSTADPSSTAPTGSSTSTSSETPPPVETGTVTVSSREAGTDSPLPGAVVQVSDSTGFDFQLTTPATITVASGRVGVTAVSAPAGYRFDGHAYATGLVTAGSNTSFGFVLVPLGTQTVVPTPGPRIPIRSIQTGRTS